MDKKTNLYKEWLEYSVIAYLGLSAIIYPLLWFNMDDKFLAVLLMLLLSVILMPISMYISVKYQYK